MSERVYLATAGNTEIPCYLALLDLGYAVRREELAGEEVWVAEGPRAELRSMAGLVALLGLARLVELRGDAWEASDEAIEAFLARFYPGE